MVRKTTGLLPMGLAFNFGGHMGSTNRVFVSEQIAPLLTKESD